MHRTLSFLRCLFLLVLAILTLEVCARVDGYITYRAPFWGVDRIDNLYTTDALGKRGKPLARYRKWKLNSLGYRGPELNQGRQRIICIGASETFGLYESEDQEYPRQLESELNRRAGSNAFDVVNVAYAGLMLDNEVKRLPEIAATVRPEYSVIYPSLANYIWLSVEKSMPAQVTPAPSAPQMELRLLDNIQTLVKNVTPIFILTKLREISIEREARRHPVMARIPETSVERFRSDLKQLISGLRVNGIQPVVVTHATRFGPSVSPADRPYLVAWRKFYPILAENGFLDMENRLNNVIRQVAKEQKIILIDAALQLPAEGRYFADFSHFTNDGAARMAELLAEGLTQASSSRSVPPVAVSGSPH